jgi:hypothetical protein
MVLLRRSTISDTEKVGKEMSDSLNETVFYAGRATSSKVKLMLDLGGRVLGIPSMSAGATSGSCRARSMMDF